MLLTEWNIHDAKKVWQEEAREEGKEEILNRLKNLAKKAFRQKMR